MAGKRIAYVEVSYPVIAGLLMGQEIRHRDWIVQTNFPKDAQVVRVVDAMNEWSDPLSVKECVRVVFTSDTLPEVPEGATIPQFQMSMSLTNVAPDLEVLVH